MDIIKRHKGLALVGGLTLILIVIMFIIFARMIFSNGETEYGKRLSGIMTIENSVTKGIIDETKELDQVEDITIRTQGKIIYTTIYFKEGTKASKAKEIAANTISKYSEEVIAYYDFGFLLKENVTKKEDDKEEKKGFVIAGTKHPDNENVSWTQN